MNLLTKGTISAALLAATASVMSAAPASAYTMDFSTTATSVTDAHLVKNSGNSYTFKWGAISADYCDGGFFAGLGVNCAGGTALTLKDVALTKTGTSGANDVFALVGGPSLLFDNIGGSATDYFATTFNMIARTAPNAFGAFSIDFDGYFNPGGAGYGGAGGAGKIKSDGTSVAGSLVKDVPTPAAVLPVLGGLLGFASKRKRDQEENA